MAGEKELFQVVKAALHGFLEMASGSEAELNLDLIKKVMNPGMKEFVVPKQEIVMPQCFHRIPGEGLGDCGTIGIVNSLNYQKEGSKTAYSYQYHKDLKPRKEEACNIMLQYILNCSSEQLKILRKKKVPELCRLQLAPNENLLKEMKVRLEMHCQIEIPTNCKFATINDLFSIMNKTFMMQYKWIDCSQLRCFSLALRRNIWVWVAAYAVEEDLVENSTEMGDINIGDPIFKLFRLGKRDEDGEQPPPYCFTYPRASVDSTIHLFYHRSGEELVELEDMKIVADEECRHASVFVEERKYKWKHGYSSLCNHFEALRFVGKDSSIFETKK